MNKEKRHRGERPLGDVRFFLVFLRTLRETMEGQKAKQYPVKRLLFEAVTSTCRAHHPTDRLSISTQRCPPSFPVATFNCPHPGAALRVFSVCRTTLCFLAHFRCSALLLGLISFACASSAASLNVVSSAVQNGADGSAQARNVPFSCAVAFAGGTVIFCPLQSAILPRHHPCATRPSSTLTERKKAMMS